MTELQNDKIDNANINIKHKKNNENDENEENDDEEGFEDDLTPWLFYPGLRYGYLTSPGQVWRPGRVGALVEGTHGPGGQGTGELPGHLYNAVVLQVPNYNNDVRFKETLDFFTE